MIKWPQQIDKKLTIIWTALTCHKEGSLFAFYSDQRFFSEPFIKINLLYDCYKTYTF